jgi:hypothetical protein
MLSVWLSLGVSDEGKRKRGRARALVVAKSSVGLNPVAWRRCHIMRSRSGPAPFEFVSIWDLGCGGGGFSPKREIFV